MTSVGKTIVRGFLELRRRTYNVQKPLLVAFLRAQGVRLRGQIHVNGWPYLINLGEVEIGANVTLTSSRANPVAGHMRMSIVVQRGAKLSIGNNAGLSNCEIFCAREISIGANTLIGGGVRIYDTNFHSLDPVARRTSPDPTVRSAPIWIGEDCFIGGGVTILKGTTVGDRTVVGAGSVVSGSLPSDEIWAGNPARFIRRL